MSKSSITSATAKAFLRPRESEIYYESAYGNAKFPNVYTIFHAHAVCYLKRSVNEQMYSIFSLPGQKQSPWNQDILFCNFPLIVREQRLWTYVTFLFFGINLYQSKVAFHLSWCHSILLCNIMITKIYSMLRLACGVKAFFYICVSHWVFFVKLFSKDFKLISLLYFSSSALNGKNHDMF